MLCAPNGGTLKSLTFRSRCWPFTAVVKIDSQHVRVEWVLFESRNWLLKHSRNPGLAHFRPTPGCDGTVHHPQPKENRVAYYLIDGNFALRPSVEECHLWLLKDLSVGMPSAFKRHFHDGSKCSPLRLHGGGFLWHITTQLSSGRRSVSCELPKTTRRRPSAAAPGSACLGSPASQSILSGGPTTFIP